MLNNRRERRQERKDERGRETVELLVGIYLIDILEKNPYNKSEEEAKRMVETALQGKSTEELEYGLSLLVQRPFEEIAGYFFN